MFGITITVNEAMTGRALFGFDAEGRNVVCVECLPNYGYVFGCEDDVENVIEWMTNSEHAHRMAMVAAWRAGGFKVAGVC